MSKFHRNNRASAHMLSPIPEHPERQEGSENARIRVVVRVRPLNAREKAKGHKMIVHSPSDQTVMVWDPASFESKSASELSTLDPKCWAKTFSFDKILWSVDRHDPRHASQDTIFEMLGQPVIDWVADGFNCCVLAYGQTGTGKTYTMSGDMRGDPSEYGLVPRICFGLFDRLESQYVEGDDVTVTFSHMEIYNENVRDLLAPNNAGYLRVREHPQQGVFVSNLTTIKVGCFEDVMSLIAIGDKNRTVASTNANAHSSRSHAIVNLTVIQRKRNAPKHGLPTSALQQKIGRVYLVDLAGSERVTFSGAKGDRLKEANHINLSLSVLGDVIKSLGETKGGKRGHIPYRNSTLTLVLKESLGGNSHAVMVTAVSPSSIDYEETISTLKYADRAKRVRMHVEANITSGLLATDSSAVELVPLLQAEVRKLREMLNAQQQLQQAQQISPPLSASSEQWALPMTSNPRSEMQTSVVLLEMKERVRELEHQLADRERLIESLEVLRTDQTDMLPSADEDDRHSLATGTDAFVQFRKSLSDSISGYTNSTGGAAGSASEADLRRSDSGGHSQAVAKTHAHPVVMLADDAVDTSLPRVTNLNQDPLFSECLVYYLPEGTVIAGSKSAQADILLSGPDIVDRHCVLNQVGGRVWLLPLPGALVFVNGDLVEAVLHDVAATLISKSVGRDGRSRSFSHAGRELQHFDRIAFGRFHLFRFEASGKVLAAGGGSSDSRSSKAPPGWEYAQEELLRKNDAIMSLRASSEIPLKLGYAGEVPPSPRGHSVGSRTGSKLSSSPTSSGLHARSDPVLSMPKITISPPRLPSMTSGSVSSADKRSSSVAPLMMERTDPGGNLTENEWWERLSKIAEGSEVAEPNELQNMLRGLVGKAEDRLLHHPAPASAPGPSVRPAPQPQPQPQSQPQPQIQTTTFAYPFDQTTRSPLPSGRLSSPVQSTFNKPSPIVTASSRGSPPPPPPPNTVPPPLAIAATASATVISAAVTMASPPPPGSDTLTPHEVFAREALALQEELAGMQKTLEDRMQRYQKLIVSASVPNT